MPEETPGQTPAENHGETGNEFTPITSQDQLDRLIGGRINAVKQQYADYDDLKSKADKFDKAEDANKTELERLQEANKTLTTENGQLKVAGLRAEVAATKGVPASSLTGSTKEELEKSADDLIAWRDEHTPKTRTPPRQLRSGSAGSDPALTKKEQAAAALREMRANR